MQTKGFVTLAVGSEKYYVLAENLLKSYRYHSTNPLPFAIVADRENEVTKQFDKTVLLPDASRSYMDKIEMLNQAPFDENIFIDADCLAYGDLNEYWPVFATRGGIRCFGHKLPLDSSEGWFTLDNIGEYKKSVHFTLQMHGGIIYFAKDELTEKIYSLAKRISANYENYRFQYFEKPADEPILALSMAVCNCPPVEWDAMAGRAYLFYPVTKEAKHNILTGELSYTQDGSTWISNVLLMHWQNVNTEKPAYWREIQRLKAHKDVATVRYRMIQISYYLKTQIRRIQNKIKRCLF